MIAGTFAACRVADAPLPSWAMGADFFSVALTADGLSIVCREGAVPEGVVCERGWLCPRVAGAVPFAAVGVLASLTAPLAEAGISLFAISTFDTDYLLVKAVDFGVAVDALRRHGHTVA